MGTEQAIQLVMTVAPAQWCQICFLLAACAVLAVAIVPSAERKLLVNYGARGANSKDEKATTTIPTNNAILSTIRKVTSLGQVPHSWFIYFYVSYLACAVFWAIQYFQGGHILRFIAIRQQDTKSPSMTQGQLLLVWSLMLLQAARRLYECLIFSKPSKSTMWFVHWLLGLFFYLGMSCAIWIEGSDVVLKDPSRDGDSSITSEAFIKVVVSVPVCFCAWIMQYRCHKYLAGLKKYSLPDDGMFRHLICPHYTCECLVYFSLAIVAAPEGQLCNRTLLYALVFVAANLGVTACGTRTWYVQKFGSVKVTRRRILVPFLY